MVDCGTVAMVSKQMERCRSSFLGCIHQTTVPFIFRTRPYSRGLESGLTPFIASHVAWLPGDQWQPVPSKHSDWDSSHTQHLVTLLALDAAGNGILRHLNGLPFVSHRGPDLVFRLSILSPDLVCRLCILSPDLVCRFSILSPDRTLGGHWEWWLTTDRMSAKLTLQLSTPPPPPPPPPPPDFTVKSLQQRKGSSQLP